MDEKEEFYFKDKNNPVVRSENEVEDDLKKANLEEIGFVKSKRTVVETVNGVRRERKFVKYSKVDLCTREKYWQEQMAKRLPKHFFSDELSNDLDKEVRQKKPVVPKKYCDIGIEIELRPDGRKRFFFFGVFVFFIFG